MMDSSLIANINDSFDTESIHNRVNLDVYEKSLDKLAQENKILRRRVAKLTELARTKEQQLIDAFNQACELKRKNEEMSQIEHNAQLQSYYECFLQIEKENNSLKSKIEQMRAKLSEQQEKIDSIVSEKNNSNSKDQTNSTKTSDSLKASLAEAEKDEGEEDDNEEEKEEEEEEEKSGNSHTEVNRLSMKHMNEEMNEVNRQTMNGYNHMNGHDGKKSMKNGDHKETTEEEEKSSEALTLKQQRINELEMELDTLNNKLKNIEACLARWIFRACDYKLDLDKMKEKGEMYEQQRVELEQTRGKLSEALEKVDMLTNELEINKKALIVNKPVHESVDTQTDSISTRSSLIQTDELEKVANSTQTEPATTTMTTSSTLVNKLASKSSSSISSSSGNQSTTSAATNPSPELIQLKTRIDNLILEKNSLRVRNEELTQDLETANKKLTAALANPPVSTQHQPVQKHHTKHHATESKSCQTSSTSSLSTKCVNAMVQTDRPTLTTMISKAIEVRIQQHQQACEEAASSVPPPPVAVPSAAVQEERIAQQVAEKLEQTKQEWDLARIKLEKKLNEERMANLKMTQDLDTLKANMELERADWETRVNKLLAEFNQSKQISDTIINQQKKLLDYLQVKLKDDESGGSSSHHHNIINLLINKKKIHKPVASSNPLLANLHKTTNQAFMLKQAAKVGKTLETEKTETKTNPTPTVTSSSSTAIATLNGNYTNGQHYTNGHSNNQNGVNKKSEVKITEIVSELNSHYQTYSEMRLKQNETPAQTTVTYSNPVAKTGAVVAATPAKTPQRQQQQPPRQIHVFITGLNTCPTYCHVCQQIIPLIAYASKCQLCSFTCHSTCSSSSTSVNNNANARKSSAVVGSASTKSTTHINGHQSTSSSYDPLKYCNVSMLHSPVVALEYSSYISKLVAFGQSAQQAEKSTASKTSSVLISDYVYLDTNSKWKKVWLCLRMDEKQQEAKLDIYQSKSNLKPFDTINLVSDRIQIESSMKQIKKLTSSSTTGLSSTTAIQHVQTTEAASNGDNIYEEVSDDVTSALAVNGGVVVESLPNFETSSLVLLLYNTPASTVAGSNSNTTSNNKLLLKIGFSSFSAKNIWYDALLTSMVVGRVISPMNGSVGGMIKKPNQIGMAAVAALGAWEQCQFKPMSVQKVLKPFLELYDTVVNSYCFINDDLLALACDDGLYALNWYKESGGGNGAQQPNNVSLVKIDSVESAHKLYYESEFGKLCFIGRKSRQFLSIDVNELNACLINNTYKVNQNGRRNGRGEGDRDGGENDYEEALDDGETYSDLEDDGDEAKSVSVTMENIHQIDRCHLFECKLNRASGHWYLAVATPESISLLLYNKLTNNKYTLLKCIQTQSESPCICLKFTCQPSIQQLVYACGREFFKMDLIAHSHPTSPITLDPQPVAHPHSHVHNNPIAVCVIAAPVAAYPHQHQEAVLLCYSTYGLFLVYNFATQQWQLSNSATNKKSSSSSITTNAINGASSGSSNQSASNLLHASNSMIKWPRGNQLTPLQIEYDSSYLYLFYNDCIIVYQVSFESELALSVRKCGITFIYRPRFLSTFSNKTSNCVIISNRRLLDEQQVQQLEAERQQQQQFLMNGDLDDEAALDPLLQDLNDKICLSYFSPASN